MGLCHLISHLNLLSPPSECPAVPEEGNVHAASTGQSLPAGGLGVARDVQGSRGAGPEAGSEYGGCGFHLCQLSPRSASRGGNRSFHSRKRLCCFCFSAFSVAPEVSGFPTTFEAGPGGQE